jgi:hypothetical protein
MLIDMDETILSAYGRPEIAWNNVAAEFAGELAPLSSHEVAAVIVDSARKFWATAAPEWRLKLPEARHEVVNGGFATLAAAGHAALPLDLAIRLADRFTVYRDEAMFIFPGAHDAIDALKARGVKLRLSTCHAGAGGHGIRDLDDRRQSRMGDRSAAAPRHLCDLDGRARRRPAAGFQGQARSHHPLAGGVAA